MLILDFFLGPKGWTKSEEFNKCFKLADACATNTTCTFSDARENCKAEQKKKESLKTENVTLLLKLSEF